MTRSRHDFRLTWIALAAVVGLLSVVGDASASTGSGARRSGALACCLKRVCTVCCCIPASASLLPETTERSVAVSPRGGALATSARPCDCRSGEPAAPASRQESRSSEDRADQDQSVSVSLTIHSPTSVTFGRLILPTASAPKSPLYLSTARLLI